MTPLNRSLTDCIVQLADRALEIDEKSTAVVLYSLAGHREVRADSVLATSASEHAGLLKLAAEMGFIPGISGSFLSDTKSSSEDDQNFPL